MRSIRPLPEIVRTYAADRQELEMLLDRARLGQATHQEVHRIGQLDAERHAFEGMCRRWAPLSPISLGFEWGEEIVHEGSTDARAIVRERDLVEMDGCLITLMEATARLSAKGVQASLGGWSGRTGSIRELAGLAPSRPRREAVSETVPADAAQPQIKQNDPPLGGNYSLFD